MDLLLLRYADTLIGNGKTDLIIMHKMQGDFGVFGRIFDGVVEQVDQDIAQQKRVQLYDGITLGDKTDRLPGFGLGQHLLPQLLH